MIARILLPIIAASSVAQAADVTPMHQGLHQWPALGGKLMLVVGTYQDTVAYRRSYTFYFKEAKDETWYQAPVFNKKGLPETEWNSASGGETTLADGVVAARPDGVYFITADKKADRGYAERGDITVTWNKLVTDDKDYPDGPTYLFKPSFTRSYPKSSLTVEAVLARELKAEPKK
ncbi:hypothetical protein GTP45_27040 [Pseudoduganella sp. FT55W]|uniref:Uncharacterized protein n=1 Tax=Duganella rivi TaxID=2666083 RepID=A0A7X4GVM6_9BURK|nr:hypothetical protein [Duganella rivi]MYM70436.1 hypothetical protein [Duganella rivi]